MTCMDWLREKLHGARRDIFSEAIAATDEVTNQTRSLREQLEPYRLDRDPFASMVAKHITAEISGGRVVKL